MRSLQPSKKLEALQKVCHGHQVELVEADLLEPTRWTTAVQGCTYVIHTASPIPVNVPRTAQEVIKPALEGTLNVLGVSCQC